MKNRRAKYALAEAVLFYNHKLITDVPAQKYVGERGLDANAIIDWDIGYAESSWSDLVNHLGSKGFTDKEIVTAGLAQYRSNNSGIYDRFRGRVMFPIRDSEGFFIGFSGRILPELDNGKQGKYMNSPQSDVYDKSGVLYGLYKAKECPDSEEYIIVVEGQMDCVTAHQFGFRNVVATSGTAMSERHLELLKAITKRLIFAFDMDEAGRKALDRATELAVLAGLEVFSAEMPTGKDPDDCIRNDIEGWKKAIMDAESVDENKIWEKKWHEELPSEAERVRIFPEATSTMAYNAQLELEQAIKDAVLLNGEEKDRYYKETIEPLERALKRLRPRNQSKSLISLKRLKEVPITEILGKYGIVYVPSGPKRMRFKLRAEDDNPSATIYLDQNTYWDYGDTNGSSNIDLVMKLEKCDLITAVKILAKYI